MTTMIDINTIRDIAKHHGFKEVQFNQVSRVIAFEKESPTRCRINVYYTTGTVASCLDHPRKGKTQLFRRNQSLQDIDAIFSNPRHHTGVGYYRNNDKGSWQPVDSRGQFDGRKKIECDDARRWRYIHSTQDGFCNDSQANQIAAFCNLWHELRFSSGMVTTADYLNSMNPQEMESFNQALVRIGAPSINICQDCEENQCKCSECVGSWCCLAEVLLEVARNTDGVVALFKLGDANKEGDEFDGKLVEEIMNCPCTHGRIFRDQYSVQLEKLKRQLMSLTPKIRREVIWWYITKHIQKYEPMVPDRNSTDFPLKFYGAKYCSDAIIQAHHEYGELAYAPNGKGCNCHGI